MTDTPNLSDRDFHPDHPGPLGWLIYDLHQRLKALEAKAQPMAAETVAVATQVETTAKDGVVEALHKVEDALGIDHS